jgi:hypothetical protein
MSSLSVPTTNSPSTAAASAGSASSAAANAATAKVPASIAANIALEAGVVATLSGANPASDGTADLYTNLAGLASSAGTPGSGSSIDLNAQWASAIKNRPSLAPLAAHYAATQALVNGIL